MSVIERERERGKERENSLPTPSCLSAINLIYWSAQLTWLLACSDWPCPGLSLAIGTVKIGVKNRVIEELRS